MEAPRDGETGQNDETAGGTAAGEMGTSSSSRVADADPAQDSTTDVAAPESTVDAAEAETDPNAETPPADDPAVEEDLDVNVPSPEVPEEPPVDSDPPAEPVDAGADPDAVESMLLADFETWSSAAPIEEWTFQFGPVESPYTAGVGALSDETGVYSLEMVEGFESAFALSVSNPEASNWGGGVFLWLTEFDATPFAGIRFWVRGSTPAGTFGVTVWTQASADCVEGCEPPVAELPLPGEWTQVSLLWSDFAPAVIDGESVPLPASDVNQVTFSAHMVFVQDVETAQWTVQPGAFELTVDDIEFF